MYNQSSVGKETTMKIELSEFFSNEGKQETMTVVSDLERFESKLGSFLITEKAPFELHLENQEGKNLLINGETDVTVNTVCDRCLTDVPTSIHITIDETLDLETMGVTEDEEDGPAWLEDSNLDLDKLVYDEILVNWPTKVLCREDCKGICSKCGKNLNLGTCSCDRSVPDPRMAAIQDIFNQFKEV